MIRKLAALGLVSLVLALVAGALLIHCHAVRDIRSTERAVLRLGAEEAVRRIQHSEDIAEIVRTTRVGRRGHVEVRPLMKGEPRHGRHYVGKQFRHRQLGVLVSTIEADTAKYRVTASSPVYGTRLADDGWYLTLEVLTILFFAFPVALVVITLALRRGRELNAVFRELLTIGHGGGARVTRQVALACALVFLLGMLVCRLVGERLLERGATELMTNGAKQFAGDFDGRINEMLFFIGDSITRVNRTPYSFRKEEVPELMRRHHIDEFNVINGDGIITCSSIDIEGDDQWQKEKPREFNQKLLVDGERVFAQAFRCSADEPDVYRKYAGIAFPEERGFIQIGFDEKRMQHELDYLLEDIAVGWNVGAEGYFILAKNSGEIVSSGYAGTSEEGSRDRLRTLAGCGFDQTEDAEGVRNVRLFDEDCLCLPTALGRFHTLLTVIPRSAIRTSLAYLMTLVGGILLAVLLLAGLVSSRMASLVAQLKAFIAKDRERTEADLGTAKTIQSSSLPLVFPNNDRYGVEAKMWTAREVGGDFFDFYQVPSGRFCFLIADVSGKGIPAAMFMMKAKAILKACAFERESLAEAIAAANDQLCENNEAEMFVTAWIGLYDPATGEVEYVSCGHNPPLVRRADGKVEWLRKRPSLVLAAMPGVKFRVERLTLARGDRVFLYTDGVTEAQDLVGAFYGETRLGEAVAAAGEGIVDAVKRSVDAFVGTAEQFDDITMLALTRKE